MDQALSTTIWLRGSNYASSFLYRRWYAYYEYFYCYDGCYCIITGHSLRLEALRINPYGKTIKAKAHIQSKGWVDYGTITKDTIIGTVGEKKRIECLCFDGDFEYRVHIQGSGWTDWTKADGVATLGTVGQELRIEAVQFR